MVLKGFLELGKTLTNYSFYLIVLLNVYVMVSYCDSFDFENQAKNLDLKIIKEKLADRKEKLMNGVQSIADKLDVRHEFDGILKLLDTYSNMFGLSSRRPHLNSIFFHKNRVFKVMEPASSVV